MLWKLPRTIPQEEIPQEEQQPDPARQCNNVAEWLNGESSDEEEDDGTTCKIFKISWIESTEKCDDWVQWYMWWIYRPKCYGKRDISSDGDFFVVFTS